MFFFNSFCIGNASYSSPVKSPNRIELRMANTKYAEYEAAGPYFALVRGALGDLVDGEHFFDIVAEDVLYEVLYELGWPRVIEGRTNLMAAFRGYGDIIVLQSADKLIIHKTGD